MSEAHKNLWSSGEAYENYMGRWSRRVAPVFLEWLRVPSNAKWIDVGSGTGVLSSAILARCSPVVVAGVDPSQAFVEAARAAIEDERFQSETGSAEALPCADDAFDVAVSGLVLNFVSDKDKTVAEMARAVRPGGTVASYVWDYAGHMQVMRYFFDAAIELDAAAREFDDGVKAPICRPRALVNLFEQARLVEVQARALDITAAFDSFDDVLDAFVSRRHGISSEILRVIVPRVASRTSGKPPQPPSHWSRWRDPAGGPSMGS